MADPQGGWLDDAYERRDRSYSKLMAFEASRILHRLGCDVRVFNPTDLPIKNDNDEEHPKVHELRSLSRWSDGHVWCTPEQHGILVRLEMTSQIASSLTISRRGSSRTRLTGSPCRPVAYAPLKVGHYQSSKSTAARNLSTQ